MISYADACLDSQLFGPWFAGETWATWRVLDKAIFGEALTDAETETFQLLTGLDQAPTAPAGEVWLIMGRRSGKDVKAASICAYLATIGNLRFRFSDRLVRGERGVVQLLAADRDQARVCLGYLRAFFKQPRLARLVEGETKNGLDLKNGLGVEITTSDQRRVRGRTVVAAVFDEVAFWQGDETDEDVYDAVIPGMVTIPQAMLLGISSPYARRGLLWKKFKDEFGKATPGVLIAKAPSWVMNPTLSRDKGLIAKAYANDPSKAAAEYGAEFRTDIEALLTAEAVEAITPAGLFERQPAAGTNYFAFVDPSGGSADSMTLAIAHRDADNQALLDAVRERKPPFSPESVVDEFCTLLKAYGLSEVTGDRYAGEWAREPFRKKGITYKLSDRPKTDLYRDFLPIVNSGQVELLDHKRLQQQLVSLERRVTRGGRDSIDHPPGGNDDIANAVAGAIVCLGAARKPLIISDAVLERARMRLTGLRA